MIITLVNIANLLIIQHAEVILWYYVCCTQRIYAANMLGTNREWNTLTHILHCVIIRTRHKVDYIKCQGLFFCVHAPDCLCRCMSEVLFALNCTFVSHGNVQPKYRGQSMACHCLSCTFRLWQQLTWQVLESLYRKMINPTQLAISTTVHIQRKLAKAKLVVFTNSLAFPYISNE